MFKRFVLINCPGIGVGNIRNTSANDHSLEKSLKYAFQKELKPDLGGLETLGLDAFVKVAINIARKTSVTAQLAAKTIHGEDDFGAYIELGGGDSENMPVWALLEDVTLISIGSDETVLPMSEFLQTDSDASTCATLIDVLQAPLVRNELVVATLSDFREAALDCNPTFAIACLSGFSKLVESAIKEIGNEDALIALSTTAIDASKMPNEDEDCKNEFRNELLPMFYYTPAGQTHDLGLRLLCDVGPSIAEFFNIDRSELTGASMGKWFAKAANPQLEPDSSLHS